MALSTDFEILFPRKPGLATYAGNLNFDTRTEGKAIPAFGHFLLSTTDRLHYAVSAIETQAPTTSLPRQYCGINETMWRLDNGTETSSAVFSDVIQGMVLCDSGDATNGDSVAANSTILLVGFGSSTSQYASYRVVTSADSASGGVDTAWFKKTTNTNAQFWLVVKAGPDLYAVTDAGVAVLGEWRISKCPRGSDPTLTASWGNGLAVGGPEWGITGLAPLGDSIAVGKPDGLYYYDDQTKRFRNVLPELVSAPHAVNGKGLTPVPNGVLYPTHDGHLYFFDGVQLQDVSPDKGTMPRDAGYARITAIAPIGDEVYCIRETGQNTTQGLGLQVVTYIAGTETDVTANVTDGNFSTGATLSTFGNAANDRIFIGANQPLEGICVRVTTNVNAASVHFAAPYYSNGTTGSSEPFSTSFTQFSGIRDGSILKTSGVSLVNTSFPPAASNALITWTDINSYDLSTLTQLDLSGGNSSKYWYALKATASGTGMTSGTRIDEIEVIPARAGIPITAANDFTHRWRAGMLSEVLVAKIKGISTYEWHSVYHIDTGGGVWAAAWHQGRPGQSSGNQNMGPGLVLWGRYTRAFISESPLRDVSRTIAPVIAAYGTTKPGPLLDLAPGGTYLTSGDDANNKYALKVIDAFEVMGDFLQQDDVIRIHCQMDEIDIKKTVEMHGSPWRVDVVDDVFICSKLQAWLEYADAAAGDIKAPEIKHVKVYFHIAETDNLPLAPDTQIPEAT